MSIIKLLIYNSVNMVKASDVIAEFLIHKGIQTVFGIIGSANSHIYDSFAKAGIHVYNVHNEQCAVIAAGAYYRTCGKMALALVTAGGGATNSVTGIVSLWADSIPTIVITGQESLNYVKNHTFCRMYGTQGLDIVHMVSKVTKYAKTLHDASDLQDELEISYSVAMRGRKGPVLLDVPFDIQSTNVDMRLWNDVIDVPHPIQPQDINRVVELLKNSKRPVILAGHGIKLSKSEDAFRSLMNSIQVPVLLTWSAIDLLDHKNPLFFGSPGVYGQRSANFIFQKCDVLIVIGSRLVRSIFPRSGCTSESSLCGHAAPRPARVSTLRARSHTFLEPYMSAISFFRDENAWSKFESALGQSRCRRVFERRVFAAVTVFAHAADLSDSDELESELRM
jgi:acetolactate synthase-1/2/3 large subunit